MSQQRRSETERDEMKRNGLTNTEPTSSSGQRTTVRMPSSSSPLRWMAVIILGVSMVVLSTGAVVSAPVATALDGPSSTTIRAQNQLHLHSLLRRGLFRGDIGDAVDLEGEQHDGEERHLSEEKPQKEEVKSTLPPSPPAKADPAFGEKDKKGSGDDVSGQKEGGTAGGGNDSEVQTTKPTTPSPPANKEEAATSDKKSEATSDKKDMATSDKRDAATSDKKDSDPADKKDAAPSDKQDATASDEKVVAVDDKKDSAPAKVAAEAKDSNSLGDGERKSDPKSVTEEEQRDAPGPEAEKEKESTSKTPSVSPTIPPSTDDKGQTKEMKTGGESISPFPATNEPTPNPAEGGTLTKDKKSDKEKESLAPAEASSVPPAKQPTPKPAEGGTSTNDKKSANEKESSPPAKSSAVPSTKEPTPKPAEGGTSTNDKKSANEKESSPPAKSSAVPSTKEPTPKPAEGGTSTIDKSEKEKESSAPLESGDEDAGELSRTQPPEVKQNKDSASHEGDEKHHGKANDSVHGDDSVARSSTEEPGSIIQQPTEHSTGGLNENKKEKSEVSNEKEVNNDGKDEDEDADDGGSKDETLKEQDEQEKVIGNENEGTPKEKSVETQVPNEPAAPTQPPKNPTSPPADDKKPTGHKLDCESAKSCEVCIDEAYAATEQPELTNTCFWKLNEGTWSCLMVAKSEVTVPQTDDVCNTSKSPLDHGNSDSDYDEGDVGSGTGFVVFLLLLCVGGGAFYARDNVQFPAATGFQGGSGGAPASFGGGPRSTKYEQMYV